VLILFSCHPSSPLTDFSLEVSAAPEGDAVAHNIISGQRRSSLRQDWAVIPVGMLIRDAAMLGLRVGSERRCIAVQKWNHNTGVIGGRHSTICPTYGLKTRSLESVSSRIGYKYRPRDARKLVSAKRPSPVGLTVQVGIGVGGARCCGSSCS
jgi:hypothetical protein